VGEGGLPGLDVGVVAVAVGVSLEGEVRVEGGEAGSGRLDSGVVWVSGVG